MEQCFSSSAVQSNLLDFTPEERKQEAMDRGLEHANKEWKKAARLAVIDVATKKKEFTSDDIHKEIKDVYTPDERALGGIIRNAAKNGLCRKTDQYTPSLRPDCHCRPIAVWESCLL